MMMSILDNFDSKDFILKILKYSNKIAIFIILFSLYVCYTHDTWLYVLILSCASCYLTWLTIQYIRSESDQCHWRMRSLQYDCQIASLNSRLSIVSNIIISIFGIGFSIFMVELMVKQSGMILVENISGVVGFSFIGGVFKLLMLYIVADKIHTSQLIIAILYKYSQSMRHLTLDIDRRNENNRYPVIYLDGAEISKNRYMVNIDNGVIGVTFSPTLSLNDDSIIEYKLIPEDKEHFISSGIICKESDRVTCLFKCRAIVRKVQTA